MAAGMNATGGWNRVEETFGGRKKQSTSEAERRQNENVQHSDEETAAELEKMKHAGDSYLGSMRGLSEDYLTRSTAAGDTLKDQYTDLSDQVTSQANDARDVYKNTLQPGLKDLMDRGARDSKDAMTLAQAGDPNNAVNTAWRGLYDQQAQGVGRQGLADAGVLTALGAQATAQQLGGLPMTGAQLQAVQGQNQAQAGMAYAAAQRRMNDLREQGLNVGREESGRQYERGQGAHERYRQSLGDVEGAQQRFHQDQAGYRGEQKGLNEDYANLERGMAGEQLGVRGGLSELEYGMSQGQGAQNIQRIGAKYGQQNAIEQGRVQGDTARQGMMTGLLGSALGAGGMIAGGYLGGPAMAGGNQTLQAINTGANVANTANNIARPAPTYPPGSTAGYATPTPGAPAGTQTYYGSGGAPQYSQYGPYAASPGAVNQPKRYA